MKVANFPMGPMADLMSAVVFAGICDRHPGVRFVLERGWGGWVPFMFWRFDREYDWGDPSARVFQPDIPLSDKPTEFVKRQVFFTFEVEEEAVFVAMPEVGYETSFGLVTSPVWTVHGHTLRQWGMLRWRRLSGERLSTNWSSKTR